MTTGWMWRRWSKTLRTRRPRLIYVSEFHNPKGHDAGRRAPAGAGALWRSATASRSLKTTLRRAALPGLGPPALAALDDSGLVVHLGTFSKTLAPGLRLGWLVGSPELVRAATIVKQSTDLHTASLAQRAVAELLSRFDYDAHLAQLRAVYGERCQAMLGALQRHLPASTRFTRPDGAVRLGRAAGGFELGAPAPGCAGR